VVGVHECDDLATGEFSDVCCEVFAHRALKLAAQVDDLVGAVMCDKRPLVGQRVLQDDEDPVARCGSRRVGGVPSSGELNIGVMSRLALARILQQGERPDLGRGA